MAAYFIIRRYLMYLRTIDTQPLSYIESGFSLFELTNAFNVNYAFLEALTYSQLEALTYLGIEDNSDKMIGRLIDSRKETDTKIIKDYETATRINQDFNTSSLEV